MKEIIYKPIGYVKSPYTDKDNMPKFYTENQAAEADLIIYPEYHDALLGVEKGMNLLMLFHFHKSSEHDLQVKKRGIGPLTGVFASRSSRRPNTIGVSVIKVLSVENNTIKFCGVDVLDGTPVLDLKIQKD